MYAYYVVVGVGSSIVLNECHHTHMCGRGRKLAEYRKYDFVVLFLNYNYSEI